MSHGIKLFPTVSGRQNFVASNEDWAAEAGSSINANATTITAQSALRIISASTLVGALSPAITLVGSMLPVRADMLYKTADSSQTINLSVLDQADTVIGSTNFASSAFSTTYNDWKRAAVTVTVPSGTTSVKTRICQGNNIDGELLVNEAALNENVLLMDPDQITRNVTAIKATHATLSGRRVVDVLQRHYTHNLSWSTLDGASYDRLQQFFYRSEALRLDDGEVPDNQEVFPTFAKGSVTWANLGTHFTAGRVFAETFMHSLLPSGTDFSVTGTASWGATEFANVGSSVGSSFTTSNDSMYGYCRLSLPTSHANVGIWDTAVTVSFDAVSEVRSTGVGKSGFDVWAWDNNTTVWRRVKTVPRSGVHPTVLDFRGTNLLDALRDDSVANLPLELLFRTRQTQRGSGSKLTLKNLAAYGNSGFDYRDTQASSMGTLGVNVFDFQDDPIAITYAVLDSRGTDPALYVRPPTTLTAGADYMPRPSGIALAVPSPNATIGEIGQAQVAVRYSREFLVQIEALPESWFHTGALSAHDRRLSLSLSTLRSSVFEELPL